MTDKAKDHKPVSAVITVPDPDNFRSAVHVDIGGTLQWRNDSQSYPDFEIEFIGDNPANQKTNAIFAGHSLKPVVIHVKNEGDFKYRIRHKKTDGTAKKSGPISFISSRECSICP
jgi:hypothetical protein